MCTSIAQGMAGGGGMMLPQLPIVKKAQGAVLDTAQKVIPKELPAGKFARSLKPEDLGPKLY